MNFTFRTVYSMLKNDKDCPLKWQSWLNSLATSGEPIVDTVAGLLPSKNVFLTYPICFIHPQYISKPQIKS